MPDILHMAAGPGSVVPAVAIMLILLCLFWGTLRRHLVRLTGSVVFGAAVAFGVTQWADGHRHKAVSTFPLMADVFTAAALLAAIVAFTAASLVARHRRIRSYDDGRNRSYRGQSRARAW